MNESEASRWPLLRDGLIFQLKLGLDAARDLMLSPVSLVFMLIDLVKGHSYEKSYFHRLMSFGYKTDKWINLFGTHRSLQTENDSHDITVDRLFAQVESILKDQHAKGGLTTTAKSSIDLYLNKLTKKMAAGNDDLETTKAEEK